MNMVPDQFNGLVVVREGAKYRTALIVVLILFIAAAAGAILFIQHERAARGSSRNNLALASIGDKSEDSPIFDFGVWPALRDQDFFKETQSSLVKSQADFIEADLSLMRLRVYKLGALALEVPIKSKGREGSWWETPSGLYSVETMEKVHLSGIGKVYMPWSMRFQGNFYIHGWPYYPDGEPVSSTYSGGCIRLADEDAEAVYELAQKDMPVLVHESDFSSDIFSYQMSVPEISAKSFLVGDLGNNFVLLASGEEVTRSTKTVPMVLTALLASEYRSIEDTTGTSTYTIYDYLWPLVANASVESEREIAQSFGTKEYAKLADKKLKSIGALATVVKAPSYRGPGATTAKDMFSVVKYLYNNRPFLLSLNHGSQRNAYADPALEVEEGEFDNFSGYIGGMLAKMDVPTEDADNLGASAALLFASSTEDVPDTQVGLDAFAVFKIDLGRAVRPVAFIALDSSDPAADIIKMRNYVLSQYR